MNILKRYVERTVERKILELGLGIYKIDPKSMYILLLPTDLPIEEVKVHLAPFRKSANIVVIQSDNVRLLEFSNDQR